MNLDMKYLIRTGLLTGFALFYMSLVGMVEVFNERDVIVDLIALGRVLVLGPTFIGAYFVSRKVYRETSNAGSTLLSGATIGLTSSIPALFLLAAGTNYPNIRDMFVSVNKGLLEILRMGQEGAVMGGVYLLLTLTAIGLLGGGLVLLSDRPRTALINGLTWLLGVGVMSELLNQVFQQFREYGMIERDTVKILLKSGTLNQGFALFIFVTAVVVTLVWPYISAPIKKNLETATPSTHRNLEVGRYILIALFFLLLPWVVGRFLSDVMVTIGIYIIMGLGLNIAVGLAGLLDLGYLTNFAVGAYVTGILISTGPFGAGVRTDGALAFLNLWIVIPIAVLCAMLTGFFFALPVLKMRGDYLAIATLGFGEIIGKLALSDWLKPYIGGAQGILFVPKPYFFGYELKDPQQLYYIALAGCLVMLFVMLRLNNSRVGRKWMALREDEDVAAAMGIDTVRTKVIAFTLSAAAGGLGGAIFASKVGTVFPNSFTLIVSVNVLSLIIVGGLGSIPGVVVGAIFLIGLPEILREFSEFRFLLYGGLLVAMMLTKPEGLWPSEARLRELKKDDPVPV